MSENISVRERERETERDRERVREAESFCEVLILLHKNFTKVSKWNVPFIYFCVAITSSFPTGYF